MLFTASSRGAGLAVVMVELFEESCHHQPLQLSSLAKRTRVSKLFGCAPGNKRATWTKDGQTVDPPAQGVEQPAQSVEPPAQSVERASPKMSSETAEFHSTPLMSTPWACGSTVCP